MNIVSWAIFPSSFAISQLAMVYEWRTHKLGGQSILVDFFLQSMPLHFFRYFPSVINIDSLLTDYTFAGLLFTFASRSMKQSRAWLAPEASFSAGIDKVPFSSGVWVDRYRFPNYNELRTPRYPSFNYLIFSLMFLDPVWNFHTHTELWDNTTSANLNLLLRILV